MFANKLVIICIIIIGIGYIAYSADYFTYCSHRHISRYIYDSNGNAYVDRHRLTDLCNDVFKLNSEENNLYKQIIRDINPLFFATKFNNQEYASFDAFSKNHDLNFIEIRMRLIQTFYIIFCIIIYYYLLVVIPKFTIRIFLSIISKLLHIIFFLSMICFILQAGPIILYINKAIKYFNKDFDFDSYFISFLDSYFNSTHNASK